MAVTRRSSSESSRENFTRTPIDLLRHGLLKQVGGADLVASVPRVSRARDLQLPGEFRHGVVVHGDVCAERDLGDLDA